jgi:hypothetical protein
LYSVESFSFRVRDKFPMSILDRNLVLLLACAPVLSFPLPDHFLGSLPVSDPQRLAHFFPPERSIDPDGALTVTVLPTLRAMLAALSVASINGQHFRGS